MLYSDSCHFIVLFYSLSVTYRGLPEGRERAFIPVLPEARCALVLIHPPMHPLYKHESAPLGQTQRPHAASALRALESRGDDTDMESEPSVIKYSRWYNRSMCGNEGDQKRLVIPAWRVLRER